MSQPAVSNAGSAKLHRAFAGLSEGLTKLEKLLLLDQEMNDEDRARGYIYLLGMQKWYVDLCFQGYDRDRPRFVRFHDEVFKFGFGNPDNAKYVAEIHPGTEYVIRGTRGTSSDICIETRTGMGRREDNIHTETIDVIDGDAIRVEADGSFEIRIGGEQREGVNYLATRDDATVVFVRQTLADWDKETLGVFTIEKVGPALPPAPPADPETVAARLGDIARMMVFLGTFIETDQRWEFWNRALVNEFPAPASRQGSGFFPGQHNAIMRFQLEEDEALVVSLRPPVCSYLGFCVSDPRWFVPFDYHKYQTSLNHAQARVSSDGLLHFVVSSRDPGIPNWLCTQGRREAFLWLRCQGLKDERVDKPQVLRVAVGDLRNHLPADEPMVSEQERFETLERRRLAVYRRFF